jgi:large subunit ribosomal protein L1
MAKKQVDGAAEAKPVDGAAPAPAEDKAEPKEAKPEKKPRPPKAPKPDKSPAAEGTPASAPAEAAKPEPSKLSPQAVAAAADAAGKKKKRAGVAPRRGKKLRNQLKNLEQRVSKEGAMALPKAVSLLKSSKRVKFDETVEIHMSLGVDTTQSDQLVRGTVPLPHGVGKTVRVVVFCQGDNIGKAKEAGADFAGADDLLEKIQKQNWLDFDVALATQDLMGKVSRLGKVLGPRGLMPTPKAGTVITGDVAQAVKDFKAGKVEFRTDKGGNVYAGVGKLSFEEDKIAANVAAFVDAIRAAKPSGIKGNFVKSITLSSTMGPGIALAM